MTAHTELARDFEDMVTKVFTGLAAAPGSEASDGTQDRDVWSQLDSLGLTLMTTPERAGGSGASWLEAYTLHRTAAHHGVQLPLGEHDLLGRWLADRAGIDCGGDVVAVGWARPGGDGGDGVVLDVPWGRYADRVLALGTGGPDRLTVSSYPTTELAWEHGTNLAGHPRDRATVASPATEVANVAREVGTNLRLRGALLRAMQSCGALDQCVRQAVAHAAVREQFGRPLVAFQAVQALIADAAAEAALARAATVGAVRAATQVEGDLVDVREAVAVAKSCTAHAAGPVTRKVHQVLGAIGTTLEHDLRRFTLPALAWRVEFGGAAEWDGVVAGAVRSRGLVPVWRQLTDEGEPTR